MESATRGAWGFYGKPHKQSSGLFIPLPPCRSACEQIALSIVVEG